MSPVSKRPISRKLKRETERQEIMSITEAQARPALRHADIRACHACLQGAIGVLLP
jgi:hypothetical protein